MTEETAYSALVLGNFSVLDDYEQPQSVLPLALASAAPASLLTFTVPTSEEPPVSQINNTVREEAYGSFFTVGTDGVPVESPVTFHHDQSYVHGVDHELESPEITITVTGMYMFYLTVLTDNPSADFHFCINGKTILGTQKQQQYHHSGIGGHHSTFHRVLHLKKGDILTVENRTSLMVISLKELTSACYPRVNSTLTIYKIAEERVVSSHVDRAHVDRAHVDRSDRKQL